MGDERSSDAVEYGGAFMSKEGGAAVVGIAGAAVCMPLVIAGGALTLGAYLASKGTYQAARGACMVGREA